MEHDTERPEFESRTGVCPVCGWGMDPETEDCTNGHCGLTDAQIAEALTAAAATEERPERANAMRALASGAASLPTPAEVCAAYRGLRATPVVHVAATVHSLGAPLGRVLSQRSAEEGRYATTSEGEFFCGGPRFPTETTILGGFLFRVA